MVMTGDRDIYLIQNKIWMVMEAVSKMLVRERPIDHKRAITEFLQKGGEDVETEEEEEPLTKPEIDEAKNYLRERQIAPLLDTGVRFCIDKKLPVKEGLVEFLTAI
eukprot:TRINITY_DN21757_c0_g1_i1.p1 TRINITY_DN21757_c0_g1~~TRINITY_DN21757_c0_g1_i1.p1  ORF type:complete len:106 (+),score=23.50 TRINITY_DN21757_c0_g1_i1:3-320(+)